MKPSEFSQALKAAIAAGMPVHIEGPPGIGKSQIVYQVSEELYGREPWDIRPALRQPVDFLGLPSVANGKTYWNTPDELPTEGPGILFMDELPNAPTLVQSALLQAFAPPFSIGNWRKPPDVALVSAGNRSTDRAGAGKLISSLRDRCLVLELVPDVDDWVRWALHQDHIPAEMTAFIRFRPDLLSDFDPSRNINASPRSWEALARLLAHTPEALFLPVASGIVGEGPATEYLAFRRTATRIQDPAAILLDPQSATVPVEPDLLFATCGALARLAKPENGESIFRYAERLPAEFSVLLARDALAACPAVTENKAFTAWVDGKGAVML